MDSFRSNLEEFAGQHREEIRRNPQFRSQFQEMCAAIGVDPLACTFCDFILKSLSYLGHWLWIWNDSAGVNK